VDSFDQSLKYLLHQEPADFARFALRDRKLRVLGPVEAGLPSHGRDVDGTYFVESHGHKKIAHFEFHRRHQSQTELAIDVGEAQIRLYRREGLAVVSLVWDLYGAADEPVLEERTFTYGAKVSKRCSQVVYLRVNLRGLRYKELLAKAPPALWPLVALTRDGASARAVIAAKEAIEARTDLSAADQADHLAVLWFIGEAEDVPVQVMKEYITQEKLMASSLYQSIFEKGVARGRTEGEAKGEAQHCAKMVVRHLARRVGEIDPAVAARIRSVQDLDTLEGWLEEALAATDAEGARRLIERIGKRPAS
jgi:predicted transposase YdaD